MLRQLGARLFVTVLAGILLATWAPRANAVLRLEVKQSSGGFGTGVVITDQGPGDSNPLVGAITFNGQISDIAVNMTAALSKPVLADAQLDLTSGFATPTRQFPAPQPFRVTLVDSDFTEGAPGPLNVVASFNASVGGGALTTLIMNSWVNPSNLVPDFGPDVFPAGPLGAQGAFPAGSIQVPGPTVGLGMSSFSNNVQFTSVGPYSLFADVQLLIDFSSPNLILFSDNQRIEPVSAVPEPPALALILAGLVFLGVSHLRRRNAT
jgi:hypothetical protein